MRFQILKAGLKTNIREALRKCGYFGIQDRRSNQVSYIRGLSKTQHYPRFHLYIDEENDSYKFNLHLDQKQVSYKGQHAHSGEYDEPIVNEEAKRVQLLINS